MRGIEVSKLVAQVKFSHGTLMTFHWVKWDAVVQDMYPDKVFQTA